MPKRNNTIKKICQNCGKEFETYGTNVKFCSVNCKEYKLRNKTCEICGREYTTRSRQQRYCSQECKRKGQIKEYENTCKEKYGVLNVSQIEGNRDKAKATILQRFGKDGLHSEEIRKRKAESCINKYGVSSPMKTEQIVDKVKYTMNKKYGGIGMGSKVIRGKIIKTNKEKYGVEYQVQTKKARSGTRTLSAINNLRMKLLKRFDPQGEFILGRYTYDIKIGNILIDINPFPFHNTTWHPYGKQISKDYHYKRVKNAIDNGYYIINVFDRDDPYKIINFLDNGNKINLDLNKCKYKELSYDDCKKFIDEKYLGQSKNLNNNSYYGLYNGDVLTLVMGFSSIDNKNRELSIICYDKIINIGPALNTLYGFFLGLKNPTTVISYYDMSKYNGQIYEEMGFEFVRWLEPQCHKYYYNKNKNDSSVDIYDCGYCEYIWK